MKQLKQHIKDRSFKPVYLFYGSEAYLKNLYRKEMVKAILPDSDSMNLTYLEGKNPDIPTIADTANTMPFFSEKRLIILENTGFFKGSCKLSEMLEDFPDSTIIIFIEKEVDKKTLMYKKVSKIGYVCEMNSLSSEDLMKFIAARLSVYGLRIRRDTAQYMLMYCSTDMDLLVQELYKLISYCEGKDTVTSEDIEIICTKSLSGKAFQLTNYIGEGDLNNALKLYHELLSSKEQPRNILPKIIEHMNNLLLIKDLTAKSTPTAIIAKKMRLQPSRSFLVSKYRQQSKNFSSKMLRNYIEYAISQEERFKKGLMKEQLAVELVIAYCCTGHSETSKQSATPPS